MLSPRQRFLYPALALLITLSAGAFLCWRAALPNNRGRAGLNFLVVEAGGQDYYLPRSSNTYDDVVTQVTAYNFARDGFWHTHLLPNRRGAPNVSLYDQSQSQCELLQPLGRVLTYHNAFGQRFPMISLSYDCVYTHYPPLGDWVFGVLASLGLAQIYHYKLFAIGLNCGLLLVIYAWLSREVTRAAACFTLLLSATLPAFLEWADTLYYHCLQYLLLFSGLWVWREYLRRPSKARWALTWLLFFCEALASYQLTLFYAIALFGWLLLSQPLAGPRRWAARWLPFAGAPLAAFALQLALNVSLFGVARVLRNLAVTVPERALKGAPAGFLGFIESIANGLMPVVLMAIGVGLVALARASLRATLWRPLGMLGVFAAGGASFTLVLPGTSTAHGWMMYRHLMPFTVLLLALLTDALARSAAEWRSRRGPARLRLLLLVLPCAGLLGWVAYRNALHVRHDVAWNLLRNRHHDANNLVQQALDVVHWREDSTRYEGVHTLPVSGIRAGEPPGWHTDLRLLGPGPSHYEVWWLEPVKLGRVRLLLDRAAATEVGTHCWLSTFDGYEFQRVSKSASLGAFPFVPAAGEPAPRQPYVWLETSIPVAVVSRALRLSCSGQDRVALRQIEAFSD